MLLKLFNRPSELIASISFEKLLEARVAEPPNVLLGLGVCDIRQSGIIDLGRKSCLCNYLSTLSVLLVVEAWMISLLNSIP